MVKNWKPFEGWGTGSKTDLFRRARLKLTALYLLITVVILVIYSTALYFSLAQHLRDTIDDNITQKENSKAVYTNTLDSLQTEILVIDGLVILGAAASSYALAGYTLRPIRKALESQVAFTADASHELRTPLAVMRSEIEVLLRGNALISSDAKKVLQSNLEEIQSLTDMSEQLLDLARGNKESNKFTVVDLSTLLIPVVDKFQVFAASHNISLRAEIEPGIRVRGHEQSLERAAQNLINNAIIHNPPQTKVTVALAADSKNVFLKVADTGHGMPSKDLPYIFDRFYKSDASRSEHQNSGAGLGLAIVKQIVDLHHGKIKMDSSNLGTTVTMELKKIA